MNQRYSYRAKSSTGEIIFGEIDAESEAQARIILRARELAPIVVRLHKRKRSFWSEWFGPHVKESELISFVQQLSILVSAGASLKMALEVVSGSTANANLERVAKGLIESMDSGKTVGDALEDHKNIFGPFFIAMVRAGENQRNLKNSLSLLVESYRESHQVHQAIRSFQRHLVGGALVTFVALESVVGLFLPKLEATLINAQMNLPTSMQVIFKVAEKFHAWINIFAIIVICLAGIYLAISRSEKLQTSVFQWIVATPLVGPILRYLWLGSFARQVSALTQAGAPLPEALEVAAKSASTPALNLMIRRIRAAVLSGQSFSVPLSREPFVPLMIANLVGVSEQAHQLPEGLQRIATYLSDQVVETLWIARTRIIMAVAISFVTLVSAFCFSMIWPYLSSTAVAGLL